MTAKEYLGQAYRIDHRINSKLEQVESLSSLATKVTTTMSDMPRNHNSSHSTIEETIGKIIDLQTEINMDIDQLVDLKREIVSIIKSIENKEYQTLLEKRYLCFLSWAQIAVDMGYSIENVFKAHSRALSQVVLPKLYSKFQ